MYIYIINHNYIYIFIVLFRYKIISGVSPKGWVSFPLVGMVDSVQMPAIMALLLGTTSAPFPVSCVWFKIQPTDRANGQWRKWEGLWRDILEIRVFAFCWLPFGHKSLVFLQVSSPPWRMKASMPKASDEKIKKKITPNKRKTIIENREHVLPMWSLLWLGLLELNSASGLATTFSCVLWNQSSEGCR